MIHLAVEGSVAHPNIRSTRAWVSAWIVAHVWLQACTWVGVTGLSKYQPSTTPEQAASDWTAPMG